MIIRGRIYCIVLIFAVHFAQILSFSFGTKDDRADSSMQKDGRFFASMNNLLNKFNGKKKERNIVGEKSHEQKLLPTQLRSQHVKPSSKPWILMDRTTPITSQRNARTIATGNMNGLEEEHATILLEYIDISDISNQKPTTGSKLQQLNKLLGQSDDNINQSPTVDSISSPSISERPIHAKMAFKIEITPESAEITVSVASHGKQQQQGTNMKTTKEVQSFEGDADASDEVRSTDNTTDTPPMATDELHAIAPSTHNPDSHSSLAIYPSNTDGVEGQNQHSSESALSVHSESNHTYSHSIPLTLNATTTLLPDLTPSATDLSYLALFCFGLGILCTYALSTLYDAAVTWYRTRIPRYIASLEKQSIALLNGHKYAQVKTLLQGALPTVEREKGPRHTDVAAFRHFLGKALLALGERDAACNYLRSVVRIYESYGEDMYMAHALEDLALAQQQHSNDCAGGTTTKNATALSTMQRALRIFTEEALAAQALNTQALEQSEDEEVTSPGLSIISHSDTTCDSDSECSTHAATEAASPGEFAICCAGTYGAAGSVGSALWDRADLPTASSDDEEEFLGGTSMLTHSLDSQDPHSPIYRPGPVSVLADRARSSRRTAGKTKVDEECVHIVKAGRRAAVSISEEAMLNAAGNSSGRKSHAGEMGSKGSAGGEGHSSSPDNENTNPNNKTKRKKHIHTPNISSVKVSPTAGNAQQPASPHSAIGSADASLRTALADLERLLDEPAASPNTLLGPTTHSPEHGSALYDISEEYDLYMNGSTSGGEDVNLSTHSGFVETCSDVYGQFDSEVKATVNPLLSTLTDTLRAERDLHEALLRTPFLAQESAASPLECVRDVHVGRVLHRVATLLTSLGRHSESLDHLSAASTVYSMLCGREADCVRSLQAEIVHAECALNERIQKNNEESNDDISSTYSPGSVRSDLSTESFTPLTSVPRRTWKSKT